MHGECTPIPSHTAKRNETPIGKLIADNLFATLLRHSRPGILMGHAEQHTRLPSPPHTLTRASTRKPQWISVGDYTRAASRLLLLLLVLGANRRTSRATHPQNRAQGLSGSPYLVSHRENVRGLKISQDEMEALLLPSKA